MVSTASSSDQELEALLAGGESDRVERKGSLLGEAVNAIREASSGSPGVEPCSDIGRTGGAHVVAFYGLRDFAEIQFGCPIDPAVPPFWWPYDLPWPPPALPRWPRTSRLGISLQALVDAEARGRRMEAVVIYHHRLNGDRVWVRIDANEGQGLDARRAVASMGGELVEPRWRKPTDEMSTAWLPISTLVAAAEHEVVRLVRQVGHARPYPPALPDPNALPGWRRLSSLEPDLYRYLRSPDRAAYAEYLNRDGENPEPAPPGYGGVYREHVPPRMLRFDGDRVLIRLDFGMDPTDVLASHGLTIHEHLALDWRPGSGDELTHRLYTYAPLDRLGAIAEDRRVVRLMLPGFTPPSLPLEWTAAWGRRGRWPRDWGATRSGTTPAELPWPPPVPDAEAPLPAECERLAWMDPELLEVATSRDPVGTAAWLEYLPSKSNGLHRIHVEDGTISVSLDLAEAAGDLAERHGLRAVRRYPADNWVPYDRLAALAPMTGLCALANDPRVRRIQAPGPIVDLVGAAESTP